MVFGSPLRVTHSIPACTRSQAGRGAPTVADIASIVAPCRAPGCASIALNHRRTGAKSMRIVLPLMRNRYDRPIHRALAVGPLRAFEAVARRASFSAAADELHLTQPAISRQIKGLEDELGAPLFLRGTRRSNSPAPVPNCCAAWCRCCSGSTTTVRQIRSARGRRHVSITTFASFASLWLLPRWPRSSASMATSTSACRPATRWPTSTIRHRPRVALLPPPTPRRWEQRGCSARSSHRWWGVLWPNSRARPGAIAGRAGRSRGHTLLEETTTVPAPNSSPGAIGYARTACPDSSRALAVPELHLPAGAGGAGRTGRGTGAPAAGGRVDRARRTRRTFGRHAGSFRRLPTADREPARPGRTTRSRALRALADCTGRADRALHREQRPH